MLNYSFITINEIQNPFCRLVNSTKRFIIANAHPIIPHDVIIENLILEGIKPVSPITFMKAGFQNELAHISSFCRQLYTHPDDIANVPSSLLIKYDSTDFKIFLTLTCFLCKQSGHTSNFCKKELTNSSINNHILQTTIIEENMNNASLSLEKNSIIANSNDNQDTIINDPVQLSKPINISNIPTIFIPNEQFKRTTPSSSCLSPPTCSTQSAEPNDTISKQPKSIIDKMLDSNTSNIKN